MIILRQARIAALVTTAVVLCPRNSTAMDIRMFERLADEDQRKYVEYLLEVTQKLFIEIDQKDSADKVERLFEAIPPGADRPTGEGQMKDILQRMRRISTEQGLRSRWTQFGEVETALIQTLVNNGISIPRQFQRSLDQHLKEKPSWPRKPLRISRDQRPDA